MTDTSDDVGQIIRDSPTGQLGSSIFGGDKEKDKRKKLETKVSGLEADKDRRRKRRDASLLTEGFAPTNINQGF